MRPARCGGKMSTPDGGDLWVVGAIISVVGLIGGVLARDRAQARQIREADDKLHDRISRVREELGRDLQVLRQDFTEYKLVVAREYASVEHLKEVEDRLVNAIDKLTAKLDVMPGQLAQELRQVMKGD